MTSVHNESSAGRRSNSCMSSNSRKQWAQVSYMQYELKDNGKQSGSVSLLVNSVEVSGRTIERDKNSTEDEASKVEVVAHYSEGGFHQEVRESDASVR